MKRFLNKKILYISVFLIELFSIFFNPFNIYAILTTTNYAWTSTDLVDSSFLWADPTNVQWDTTNTFAQVTLSANPSLSNTLAITNFNFVNFWIPTWATINWIEVNVERLWSNASVTDFRVQLTKNGTTWVWNNLALNTSQTTKAFRTYWNFTNLWWTSWSKTDIESPNFWVLLQYNKTWWWNRTARVYRVNITIDYTNPLSKPGWVSNNLSIWLKANKWTSTIIDWTSLTNWNDQSWNWFNAWWWISPTYINNTVENLNFNPYINFNWSTQYLENTAWWAYSQSYFAVVVPNEKVDWTLNGWVPFAINCDTTKLNTGTCWLPFWWLVLWAFTAAINDEVITHAIWASTEWRSAQIWIASYQASKPMLININENSAWTWTEISEKWILVNNFNTNTYQTLSATNYRLWISTDPANPFAYNWKIAEIINYSSRISPIDKQKIESYLSLKYWITLKNGTINYIASDWITNMWNTSTAWIYNNNIFGIGRDDLSWLSQIKSKSINNDSIITIEALWEGTNMNPNFVDMNDMEFLTIWNNLLWNTWSQTDSPLWYYSLSRRWKVQETGEVWTVNLDFNVDNPFFDVPILSTWSVYYFIYDTNGNWLLEDETPQAMTNIWWNIWRIWWININNNRIFSIATQSSLNNIPTNISLSNNSINENVATGSTIWTFSTTDADTWDTHTYSFVIWSGDNDNQYFTITWNTLKLIHSPDFEIKNTYSIRIQTDDGNGWQYQKVFTININDVFETIPSTLDFESILDNYKYTVTSWIWSRTTTNPYEWLYSIESNNLWTNNSQSCFELNNTLTQTWTINFYYNVSSQAWSDYLKFYINNIEQQAWSWNIPWTLYENTTVPPWTNSYKWCYIKDAAWSAWSDKAWIDFVATEPTVSWENIPRTITSINFASGKLLPWWNHNIIINYFDTDSWINTSSDIIELYKWNWNSWWSDISNIWLNLWTKTITSTGANYSTNNLSFWKYKYDFQISDNNLNSSSTWAIFYIDQPEIIVSSWSIDIWDLKSWVIKFSSWELIVTVKTVWAWFNLILNKDASLSEWTIDITNWNWINWFWFDKDPYTSNINLINTNEILANQTWSINIDWNKNTYLYSIKFWTLISPEQIAWNYKWLIRFGLKLNY